jgi:hypothetical protein
MVAEQWIPMSLRYVLLGRWSGERRRRGLFSLSGVDLWGRRDGRLSYSWELVCCAAAPYGRPRPLEY